MNRREFLLSAAAAGAVAGLRAADAFPTGIAVTCFMTVRRPKDSLGFLEYASTLGGKGIQTPLTSLDPAYLKKFRKRLDDLGYYFESMAAFPKQDPAPFEAAVKGAKECGANCIRCSSLGTRRYETFDSYAAWKQWSEEARTSLFTAVSIAEKHKLPIALENHKDWTLAEHVALLKQVSSEYLGACLDTGNNIALLDDPMEVVEALAPYAICLHLKDMRVAPAADGFLLSEVPFGDGFLEMRRMVETVRKARPTTPLTIEMITRNPLLVPCLTQKYWATFPDRSGYLLARTLRLIQQSGSKPMPTMPESRDAQLAAEEANVKRCLDWLRGA